MLQAPLVLLMLADIARIVRKRRHLWPPISLFGHQVSMAQVRGLLVASGASWSLQISFFVQFFLSVVLVSRQFGAEDTNAYGTIMRVLILGNAVISLVAWPIIPAIADAASRGDRAWARRYSLRLLGFTFLVAAIGGALIAVAGPAAISIWLRGEVTVPSLMAIGFGLLFLGYNMAFAGYTLLMGLGLENGVGRVFLLEVAIGLCVAVALAPTTGASGFALAIGGASILFSGWLLPFRVFRGIRIDHVP
jgi:O-antigen/teichoic acid export membrane protein